MRRGKTLRLWTAGQGRFSGGEGGASMVEYAFLIALIAMVVIAGAMFFRTELNDSLTEWETRSRTREPRRPCD